MKKNLLAVVLLLIVTGAFAQTSRETIAYYFAKEIATEADGYIKFTMYQNIEKRHHSLQA